VTGGVRRSRACGCSWCRSPHPYRLLGVLGADQATLDRAQAERGRVLEELAPRPKDKEVALQTGQPQGGISKGTVVRLRARPDITGAVLDVLPGDPEARYTVFHGGEVATYYESQVEPRSLCGRSSRSRRNASQAETISARDELECWDVAWTGDRTAWPATRFQQGVDR